MGTACMSEPDIRLDSHHIPRHAFEQSDGRVILCGRNPRKCKECAAHGVPPVPPDPFQVMIDQFKAHWHLRWMERFEYMAGGARVIALSDDGKVAGTLARFGLDDSIMNALGALCHVHNEMLEAK